jgi:hypothetical protein
MTKLLDKALEAVRLLPPGSQDKIARFMLALAGDEEEPDPAHVSAILEGIVEAKRGQFATDSEVDAAFRRFDR